MKTFLDVKQPDRALVLAMGAQYDQKSGQLFVPDGLPLAQFSNWLPATTTAQSLELVSAKAVGISLTELLARVSGVIKSAFADPVWVRIEISQLRSHGGHLYLAAVERDENGNEVSKANAQIWSGQVVKLVNKFSKETGVELAAGIKLLVQAKPVFKPQYGFSLEIVDIDPSYTLGDMEARLKRIREKLEATGIANLNKCLPTPEEFLHVVVICPPGAAGEGDFKVEADRIESLGLCRFTYFNALFQGERAKESLRDAFLEAHGLYRTSPFCALVIIRGGGATADLHWLNEYVLAGMVCKFPCPVFVGVGHERDSTILDEYANRSFGTPSKVIAHIREVISARALRAYEHWTQIIKTAETRLANAEGRIGQRMLEIGAAAGREIDHASFDAERQFQQVTTLASSTLEIAAERVDATYQTITGAALATVEIASPSVAHLHLSINDGARNVIAAAEIAVRNDFDSITLAARRSIDGIDDHLADQWGNITSAVALAVTTAETNVKRHMDDVGLFATRSVDHAEKTARDMMSEILAHGVEPTLRRGFAIVKAGGTPVSSKAAAEAHAELDIEFKDGSIHTLRKGPHG